MPVVSSMTCSVLSEMMHRPKKAQMMTRLSRRLPYRIKTLRGSCPNTLAAKLVARSKSTVAVQSSESPRVSVDEDVGKRKGR